MKSLLVYLLLSLLAIGSYGLPLEQPIDLLHETMETVKSPFELNPFGVSYIELN